MYFILLRLKSLNGCLETGTETVTIFNFSFGIFFCFLNRVRVMAKVNLFKHFFHFSITYNIYTKYCTISVRMMIGFDLELFRSYNIYYDL